MPLAVCFATFIFVGKISKIMASIAVHPTPGVGIQETNEPQQPVSWQEFEEQYLCREDAFKYEWVRGAVVKTPRAMNQYQYFILLNLQRRFAQLKSEQKVAGEFLAETDTFFLKKVHRRLDMAWFDDDQLARMAHRQNQVPKFVIEIISDNDIVDNLLDKLKDYRDAEVAVIWLISPKLEQVHIYKAGDATICTGDDICTAAPVLPEFQLKASEIFVKPALPEEAA